MAITSLSGFPNPLRHQNVAFYKEAIKLAGIASDLSVTSGTTTLTTWGAYKNLSVSLGATLQLPTNGELGMLFVDTLTLNGTIQAALNSTTTTASYGGASGAGAGNILIFARQILGTGTLNANGTNATSPTSNASGSIAGNNGANGQYLTSTSTIMYGSGGFDTNTGGGIGGLKPTVSNTNTFAFLFAPWLYTITDAYKLLSGSGGSGSSCASGQSRYNNGGGGGASMVAAGGDKSAGSLNTSGTGGHGGGGGGYVYIMTESAVPAIAISANGGNGSAGYSSGGGGGGGGGGLISILAPSNGATSTVTAGTGGGTASAGTAGLSVFLKENLT